MATDPNKKTLRHFQCRDYLWETFEQLSAELECSVDYLINEAMRQYARSRQQGNRVSAPPAPPATPASPTNAPSVAPPPPARAGVPAMPAMPGMPARAPSIPAMPAPGGGAPKIPSLPTAGRAPMGTPSAPMARPGVPAIPPLRPSTSAMPAPPARPAASAAPPPVNNAPRVPAMPAAPPPMAAPPRQAPAPAPAASLQLVAIYENQDYPVTKEEFIIGRGQKTSDLCIRDSNVSRRHAVVVLHNGQYWMVDQQSTNGVEFLGAKIDRKRIDHGDVFKICDYEVTFVYR